MIDTRFSGSETEILRKIVGEKLIFIESTEVDEWSRIYGNVVIGTETAVLEIRNEVEEVPYFDATEDISVFHIRIIDENHKYAPMILGIPIKKQIINSIINEIMIIEDEITILNSMEEIVYRAIFDTALVIKTEHNNYIFSRGWYFGEEILFHTGKNYSQWIYSENKIIHDWSDDELNYTVKCCRKEKILK